MSGNICKIALFLFIALIINSCSVYKVPSTDYYLDKNGNSISKEAFDAKLISGDGDFALWKYAARDNSMVIRFSHPVYETYNINYRQFKESMTILTGNAYTAKTTFILHYTFKDDYCTNQAPNEWNSQRVGNSYRYISRHIKQLEKEYPQVKYSSHFENGIKLPELKEKQSEFIFKDQYDFLRKNIFRNPSLCGSYAIIKPNGEMLIRNGEYGLQGILEHLKPTNWSQFFPENQKN